MILPHLHPVVRSAGVVLGLALVVPARLLIAVEPLPVEPPTRSEKVRFEEEVLPFLVENCTACHNAQVREGGLMLDSVKSIVAGGDSGPAVVAGRPDESVLFLRATHRQEDVMPPADNKVGARPLAPRQLGLLERWIAEGAEAGPSAARGPIAWRPLPRGTGPVVAVAITDDGRTIAAARGDSVAVHDARSGRELGRLIDPATVAPGVDGGRTHIDPITALAFAPGGDRLATGSFRTVKVWRKAAPLRLAEIADSSAATVVSVAPAGTVAALGRGDGTLTFVDVGAGRVVRSVDAHTGPVTALAFEADGSSLHSAGEDGVILTTRVDDGAAIGRLSRKGAVSAIVTFAAGRKLATAEADKVVRIWQLPLPAPAVADGVAVEPLRPLKELTGIAQPTTTLMGVRTMPDHLVTGGGDGLARLWKADTAAVVRQFAHEAPIVSITVSPDGTRLATAGGVPGVKVWDMASGKRLAEARGDHRIADRHAALGIDVLVAKQDVEFAKAEVAAAEKEVESAGKETKKVAEQLAAAEKKITETVKALAAVDAARQEAVATAARFAAAVTVASEVYEAAMNVAAAAVATVKASTAAAAARRGKPPAPDEAPLIAEAKAAAAVAAAAKVEADKAVVRAAQQLDQARKQAADADTKSTASTATHAAAVEAKKQAEIAVTVARRAVEAAAERGKKAAADVPLRTRDKAAAEARLGLAEAACAPLIDDAAAAMKPFVAVTYSSDGTRLACLEADGRLVVLGGADGHPRLTWDGVRPGGRGTAAFVDATRLLVAGAAAPAAIWRVTEPWSLERTIGGEGTAPAADDEPTGPPIDRVTAIAFSPDGGLVAAGSGRASRSGEIKLWRVGDGVLVRSLTQPHSDTVMALAFSRRGDLLASGAADRFLRVHAVSDGTLVRSYEGHTGHVLGVAWQANGRRLASGGADNTVKLWNYASGEQQRTIVVGKKEVTAVAFVASSEEVLVAAGDPLLRLYNAATGALVREFRDPGTFPQAAAASFPFATAGCLDGRLRIWDLAGGTPTATVEVVPAR